MDSEEKASLNLVAEFRGRRLPAPAALTGYSALIQRFDLPVPLHHTMAAVASRNVHVREGGWTIYPAQREPGSTLVDQLVFALKYEGLNLLTLKKLFQVFDRRELEAAARAKRISIYLRRICFLYEWLIGEQLDVPDTPSGSYIEAIDPRLQYAAPNFVNSTRFRIRDNLPGTPQFCPLVSKTHRIDSLLDENLDAKAAQIAEGAPPGLVARAAAFLLLSDSKASFDIEGERPSRDRIARWGTVIGKAGDIALTTDALIELQRIVIGDSRLVHIGLRQEGGFVGHHDQFGHPLPEHISARHGDLGRLLEGLREFDAAAATVRFHPVLTAACVAFGFVYIHPFEDGNGRIHRFLMHHVLAERRFTPAGLIFPISTVILDDIIRYRDVLQSVSKPLLEWISWTATPSGNVDVLNDTIDFYRYFDATPHCEYLFDCIERTVAKELPQEIAFLERRDAFHRDVTAVVDMGERKLDLLLRFLRQNHGTLSKRARTGEFAPLTDDEVDEIESVYRDLFT